MYLEYHVGLERVYREMPSVVLGLNRACFRYTNILASYLEAQNLMVYIASGSKYWAFFVSKDSHEWSS